MIRISSFRFFKIRNISKALPAIFMALSPHWAHAQVVGGSDPAGSGPIVGALLWLQGTLLGNVATAVAVMAVAAVGFLMLTGRMNWRFGATVIIGCFILFGAGAIVSGIQSAAAG
ncbi:MAG: TrbC/VirB2 family protein [Rhodothermales bacterium]